MDAFEQVLVIFLEEKGYWVKQSVKVELDKTDKKLLNAETRPRAEIDLVAFNAKDNELLLIEAKSYFNNDGVKIKELNGTASKNSDRFRLLNDDKYQEIIKRHIKSNFEDLGLINVDTKINFGLAAGKVQPISKDAIKSHLDEKNYKYFDPEMISDTIKNLANNGWDDSIITVTAKIIASK